MLKRNIQFIAAFLVCYYIFIYFADHETFVFKVSANLLQLFPAVVSTIWLASAAKHAPRTNARFLGLLAIANSCCIVIQFCWMYYELVLHIDPNGNLVSAVFSFIQIAALFTALLYKVYKAEKQWSLFRLLFDISILVIVMITAGWQLIFKPTIAVFQSGTWAEIVVSTALPVADVSLLFAALALASLKKSNLSKTLLPLGIIAKVLADALYLYQSSTGVYYTGSWIEPIWSLSLLLIGLTGTESEMRQEHTGRSYYVYEGIRFSLPYIGVIILFCITVQFSPLYNVSVGLAITIILVLIRQVAALIRNESLVTHLLSLTKDLDQKVKSRTEELEHLAFHDPVTSLPNRRLFSKHVSEALLRAKERNYTVIVMFLDLDRFKYVNDVMGHAAGDLFLHIVSTRLIDCVEKKGFIARQGGDEFTILLEDMTAEQARDIAEDIRRQLNSPFALQKEYFHTTASIGISMFPDNGSSADELLKQADTAMYRAKDAGKNTYRFYNNDMKLDALRRMRLENGLQTAIAQKELFIYYQPQVDLRTNTLMGAEALLRWKHEELGFISPAEFIPIAEETGLIIPIGEWILRNACIQAKQWHESGHILSISVNISPRQFNDERFIPIVETVLQETKLDPQLLCLEITESVAISSTEEVIKKLRMLRRLGAHISIDDFGTGFSSLNYLSQFPISSLKIDKSFIERLQNNQQIVHTVLALGSALNVSVVAEGVENIEQVNALTHLGCPIAQGYYFSKPLPANSFTEWMQEVYSTVS